MSFCSWAADRAALRTAWGPFFTERANEGRMLAAPEAPTACGHACALTCTLPAPSLTTFALQANCFHPLALEYVYNQS